MEDIGSGFFKLPELEYIQQKPKDEYNYPTSGMLHSDKFTGLLKLLFDNNLPEIYYILDGHVLQEELSNFDRNQLADFCRHVLIVNRDKIGWQVVDKYLALIDKNLGKASWEKPKFIFTSDFNQILSSIYRWEISKQETELLVEYINTSTVEYLSKDKILENLSNNYQFWNIREIFLLFEDLTAKHLNNKRKFEKYFPLLDSLRYLILDRINSKGEELKKRIVYLFLFSRSLVKINFLQFQEVQSTSARIWVEIENNFDKRDVDSYRYLFSVIHAHLGVNYYQYNIDFIHKRQLINLIIAAFFQFPEIDIGDWLNKLVNSDVDQLVVEFIVHGYTTVVTLLDDFTKELPPSSTYDKIHTLFIEVSNSIFDMTTKFLIQRNDNTELDTMTSYRLGKYSTMPEKYRIIKSIIKIRALCMEFLVYFDDQRQISPDDIKNMSLLNEMISDSASNILYSNHLLMMIGNYPFQNFLAKIEYEAEQTNSIVSSSTFEKEIIVLTSSMMEEIKQHYMDTGMLLSHELDKLLYFIAQWLLYFKENSFLYEDFVMICSPLISIIMVQLIQAYHVMNKHIMVFLMYLNMQHFTVVMRDAIDLIGSDKHDKSLTYYSNDFREMISAWDIELTTDVNQVNDSIKNIQNTNANSTLQSGMLEDDVLMGFINYTNTFEQAIKLMNQGGSMSDVAKVLKIEDPRITHLYQCIGRHFQEKVNFPLIKNIFIFNAALTIIPVEIHLTTNLLALDINSMINYFFREEN